MCRTLSKFLECFLHNSTPYWICMRYALMAIPKISVGYTKTNKICTHVIFFHCLYGLVCLYIVDVLLRKIQDMYLLWGMFHPRMLHRQIIKFQNIFIVECFISKAKLKRNKYVTQHTGN